MNGDEETPSDTWEREIGDMRDYRKSEVIAGDPERLDKTSRVNVAGHRLPNQRERKEPRDKESESRVI